MAFNEHTKWRDFLRHLVEAAVTALAVYAAGGGAARLNYKLTKENFTYALQQTNS